MKNTSESKGSCWVHRFCCWVPGQFLGFTAGFLVGSCPVHRFYCWRPGGFWLVPAGFWSAPVLVITSFSYQLTYPHSISSHPFFFISCFLC